MPEEPISRRSQLFQVLGAGAARVAHHADSNRGGGIKRRRLESIAVQDKRVASDGRRSAAAADAQLCARDRLAGPARPICF